MPPYVAWNTPEGKAAVKTIVQRRIPQWKDSLHARQEEPTLLILDRKEVLLCTATGDGKSALFLVPILCHQEVSKNRKDFANFDVCDKPVGLVVTPTKGLAGSIVKSLAEYGITGISYDRETIALARKDRRNLIEEISSCRYQIICIDPEHLHASSWRTILDVSGFRKNLLYACLEEGHVADEWGATFREAYTNIGTFFRGRLPTNVPVFSISATLEPGAPTTALCKILGFRVSNFTLFRFSNERHDLQFILEPLEHGITSRSYPQLLPYLNTGRKIIIYAPSLEIVTRIYLYLFHMEPPGVDHGRRVRQYTALCDASFNKETLALAETDPGLQAIISTVALANGVHVSTLDDSISMGMPTTLSQTEQQLGRASRGPDATGKAVVLVQKSDIKNARKFLAGLATSVSTTANPGSSTRQKKKKTSEHMDPAKAEILVETVCLNAAKNRRWQNPPLEDTSKTCLEINRRFPCSLCALRANITVDFPNPNPPFYPPFLAPGPKSKAAPIPRIFHLKKSEQPIVQERLTKFATRVMDDEMYKPGNEYRPEASFFPFSLRARLTDRILRIHTVAILEEILVAAEWPFRFTWQAELWSEVTSLQDVIYTSRPVKSRKNTEARRKGKGKRKQGRKLQVWESSSESSNADDENVLSSDDEQAADEEDGMDVDPIPEDVPPPNPASTSTSGGPKTAARRTKRVLKDVTNQPSRSRPRTQPSKPSTASMKETMAAYGPVRTNNRRRAQE